MYTYRDNTLRYGEKNGTQHGQTDECSSLEIHSFRSQYDLISPFHGGLKAF